MEEPTNNTNVILEKLMPLVDQIFNEKYTLIKAGIIMKSLNSVFYIQGSLWQGSKHKDTEKAESLMKTVDMLNNRYGKGTITWACCCQKKPWEMRRDKLSKNLTKNIMELPIVKA